MTKFYQIFENCSKNSIKLYTRVHFFFRIFFQKMAGSFSDNVGRQKSWKDVSRRIFRKNFWIKTQTRTYCNLIYIYKKKFFKSAENFRYGKSSKLNMLAFRKKNQKILLWVWKFILKFKKLTKFYQIFENCSKNSI